MQTLAQEPFGLSLSKPVLSEVEGPFDKLVKALAELDRLILEAVWALPAAASGLAQITSVPGLGLLSGARP